MQLSGLLIVLARLLHSVTSMMNDVAFTVRPSEANKVYPDHLLFHSAVRSRLHCLVMCALTQGCVRVTHTGKRADPGTCRGHSTQLFPSEQGTTTPGAATLVWAGLRHVSGQPTNLAFNKATSQSSLGHHWGQAYRAVDGNLNPVYDSGSCTHTNLAAGAASWWQVDLGHAALGYDVISVVTTNREAEAHRLQDFDIHVYVQDPATNPSASGALCAHHDGPMGSAETKELVCCDGPIRGRFVRIANTPGQYLTLCEVQVMAVPAV